MATRCFDSWFRLLLALAVLMALAACQRPAPPVAANAHAPKPKLVTDPVANGAISVAPLTSEPPHAKPAAPAARFDWAPMALGSGQAWISCTLDYSPQGDGARLVSLDRQSIRAALHDCVDHGVLRLRYKGRIAADFTALVERVAWTADALQIRKRVLDLDSPGGQVEDAIKAGDFIAESRWTLWVREDSSCHSACVLLLSGGDVRHIAGRVGIHRVIRMSSTATTRADLNAELRMVYDRVRDYLERNGTSTAVADLMKAVPNRSLRLLSDEELLRFGLDGVNSAQDDLDRLRLQRECGEDFVARRDAFARAFDNKCSARLDDLHDMNACGLALRTGFGFPDPACPAESPLSEFDLGQEEPALAKDAPRAAESKAAAEPAPTTQAPVVEPKAQEGVEPADPVETIDVDQEQATEPADQQGAQAPPDSM
jgi:ATP-dependent protease ClpP protease subunit